MQYTTQLPSYFHDRDKASHNFSQHTFAGKVSSFMDQRGYNTFAHHNIPLHQYLSYDKETIRRIIQYQDETFRCQVQELHRLYKRQRELMDDITMRQIFMRDLQSQTSKSAQCLSQAQTKAEEKLSSKFFIDLNEPLMADPEPLASSSTGSCGLMRNCQAKEEAKSEAAVVKTRLEFDIDLNSMPPNFPSQSYIDLNANGEKEMEVPLSPYSNSSLETQREGKKVQELAATAAAETLLSIFSSARDSRKSVGDVISERSKSSSNPLSWFADVIISSVGYYGEEGNVCHDQNLLFKGKARYPFRVVRNETNSAATQPLKSKRVSAKNMTRDNQMIEGSNEMGSLRRNSTADARKCTELSSSYDLKKKQSVLHDWGKIKKRQEGFRRRSKYQVTT